MVGCRTFNAKLEGATTNHVCETSEEAPLLESSEGSQIDRILVWEGTIMMILARSIHIRERAIGANWY
jgi:hypothetical protein